MSQDRRLVVGLGNPGDKYRYTRHNIAWLVLDAFADRVNWRGGGKRRDAAMVHAGRVLGLDLVMAKPDTFMNESGIAVRKLLAAERVPLTALLVVVDDFSLPFGTLRFREGGSAGGHNGLTSITDELGTDKYPRLRVGIGDVEVATGEAIEMWARSGLNKAATAFNGWALPEPEAGSAADPANLPKPGEIDGPAGADGIRKTAHGWRKLLGRDKADREG